MTVFFGLSGYLITTLLVRELQSGTIDVRAFYRRRAARLYPALLTVVVATVVVLLLHRRDLRAGLFHRHSLSVEQILAPAGAAITCLTSLFDWAGHPFAIVRLLQLHVVAVARGTVLPVVALRPALGLPTQPSAVHPAHLWLVAVSLAIDLQLGLSRHVRFDPHEYFGSDTNALPILVGSLLALVTAQRLAVTDGSATSRPGALLAVVLLPAWPPGRHLSSLAGDRRGDGTDARDADRCRDAAAIGARVAAGKRALRWLGERSYSIYLWNVLAQIAILHEFGHTTVGDIAWIAMFMVLAEASFRLVERPLRSRLAPRPGPPEAVQVQG